MRVYTHITSKKLDAHLFQLRKQRLQHVQLIRSECICNCGLCLLPQGIGERNSFTSLLGDVYSMLSSVASSAHRDQPVAHKNMHIPSNGRTITSQLLGQVGNALLGFILKNAFQKHILRHLETTGRKDSIIDLGERLRCVAQSCAVTGKRPFHNVSIYPHLTDVNRENEKSPRVSRTHGVYLKTLSGHSQVVGQSDEQRSF